MSKLIHLLVAVSVAVPFVATACAKADAPSGGSQDFSKEIAEGKTLYIVSSEAECDQLVDLGPEKATLSPSLFPMGKWFSAESINAPFKKQSQSS